MKITAFKLPEESKHIAQRTLISRIFFFKNDCLLYELKLVIVMIFPENFLRHVSNSFSFCVPLLGVSVSIYYTIIDY